MANRPKGYGLTSEVNQKIQSKYDSAMEQEATNWIEALLGEELSPGTPKPIGQEKLHEALKSGVVLCNLINRLAPGSVKKINTNKMAFKMMENIGSFLTACENYGVHKAELFQTVDLYEAQNMWQVVCSLHALGRKAQSKGFDGPTLGVKEASATPRHFTDEQLKEGNKVIGLQMGSNKGASQAGQNFGKRRDIF